jgi:putative FmdB family regulatory protein
MPIYEYVCGSCKKKTEVIQRVNEAPLKVCPHCGGKLKKAISAPAIQFKGSGFYITDYARASSGAESDGKSSGEGEKADKSESKADKPEKAGKSEKVEKKADKKEKKASGD